MLRADINRELLGVMAAVVGCLFLVSATWADTTWLQQARLTASDGTANDNFGYSVSISGDYAIVGVPYDDYNGASSGSAYVFERSGSTWLQLARLTVSGAAEDKFGWSVSISGDYAIVGAPYGDGIETNSGTAYIFKRSGTSWLQQTKLIAWDGIPNGNFGYSVSISGDYAIVGVRYDDDNGEASGSAYVFKRSGASWLQQAKLTASDGDAYDEFGSSVSISSDYAIVGAPRDDDNKVDSGSVYIFERNGTNWLRQDKLTASDPGADDRFGFSVSIGGDYAIVGACWDDSGQDNSGSAYIFMRDETSWLQQTKLTAFDGDVDDEFGKSVSISDSYAVVGADYDDDKGGQSGSAYMFKRDGITWLHLDKLTASDGETYDRFGASVSLSGDYVIAGASYDDQNEDNSGSAYIFKRACPTSDLNGDCCADFQDFALFALRWLETGCEPLNWCSNADLDNSNDVDCADFAVFAKHWRETGCVEPDWCAGTDMNHSSQVDWADLSILAGHWLRSGCGPLYWCSGADLDRSRNVDSIDYAIFAKHWSETGCAEPGWCGGADLNHSGQVNWMDLAMLAGRWLNGGCDRTWCDGADLNQSGNVNWRDLDVFATEWLQCGQ